MQRIVIIASSVAGIVCATKIKRRLPESEVNIILPSNIDKLQKSSGASGKRIAKHIPNLEYLASREIGILEASSIMTDLDKQEIIVTSNRGNLPIRFNTLLTEVSSTARLPRTMQRSGNIFAWPVEGFAAEHELLDKSMQSAADKKQNIIVVGSGLPALDACFLAKEAGAKVHLIIPKDQPCAEIEPHLWEYTLQFAKDWLSCSYVESIATITPVIDSSGNCLQLDTSEGKSLQAGTFIWASQFMARHPILREDGFFLDADGKISGDEAVKRHVYLFGSGAKADMAKLCNNAKISACMPGKEAAMSTAIHLAHTIAGEPCQFNGLLGVYKACTQEQTICRAGLTLAEAFAQGIEAEHCLISEKYEENGCSGTLCLALVACKTTKTIIGVQVAGFNLPSALPEALFNSALINMAEQVKINSILCQQYTGLTGQMLAMSASILENKIKGTILGITPDELLESARSGAEFFILDLRLSYEWKEKHLENAYNIPLLQLKKRLQDEVPRFTPLVLVCNTGKDAYSIGCKLVGLGANSIYILDGGMNLWPYPTKSK